MNNSTFMKNNHAVAGVIEALLLVAMFSIILSTVQLIYIPDIMEQREVQHMDEIENQMSYLKSVIDLQSSMKENVPISSPLTLGSRELPYFVTARAFGQLDIIDGGTNEININYDADRFILTSIRYEAINSYYLDQYYILEGGGLIVKQHDGESMRIVPSISYQNQSGEIQIQWTLPIFESIAGKNSTSGFKGCYIRTNFSSSTDYSFSALNSIRIYSEYLDAWYDSLNQLFEEVISYGSITIEKVPEDNPTHVKLEPAGNPLSLEMTVATINAQIGPGIVIQS